jgi:hypothetical protein
MWKSKWILAGSLASILLAAASPLYALIDAELKLQDVIAGAEFIAVAKVASLDPDRPSMVLTIEEPLKGKPSVERMPINLTGSPVRIGGKEVLHTGELLKRLAPELPIVIFAQKEKNGTMILFGYTNGTWFQVVGRKDGQRQSWAFTHCEIYLRRTFYGTTDEMRQIVTNVLARRAKAPLPNASIAPGFGPEIAAPAGTRTAKSSGE